LNTHSAPQTANLHWRKSSYSSAQNACVEVADTGAAHAVRDSKDPGRGHLLVTPEAWRAFVAEIKEGKYNR
jgi:hypothetical protein